MSIEIEKHRLLGWPVAVIAYTHYERYKRMRCGWWLHPVDDHIYFNFPSRPGHDYWARQMRIGDQMTAEELARFGDDRETYPGYQIQVEYEGPQHNKMINKKEVSAYL